MKEQEHNAQLRPFTVGEWRVRPDLNQLERGDEQVRVQPRLIQVLRALALAGGQTVTRETLLDQAWSRRMVNDEVLSRTIADLRAALRDDARQPRYLLTIPKVGYRLIAPVQWSEPATARAADTRPEPEAVPAAPASSPPTGDAPAAPIRPGGPPNVLVLALLAGVLLAAWWALQGSRVNEGEEIPDLQARLLRARPLTSESGWELTPRVAPDGQLLAWSETAPDSERASLRLRSRDGRIARVLTDGSAYDLCPTFSPDARELAWTRHRPQACELMRAPLLGGPAAPVGSCAPGVLSCPQWVGDSLFYTAPALAADRGPGLARLDLRDGRVESLTSPAANHGVDAHPRQRPDGTIAFLRGDEADRSLWLLDSGGQPRRVEYPSSMAYGLAWLADGRLLLASDALGFRALVAVDPGDGAATLLGARGARYPDVGADGALVFEHASYDANLWLQPGDGSAAERLTLSQRYDAYPRLAPGGRRVVYQSNRDGAESLYLLDLDSRSEVRLPLDAATRWAQPAWFADASGLTLTRYAPGGIEIWRYAIGADAPQRLAVPAGAHDAQPDPDGEHLWFRVCAENDAALLRWRLDGQQAPQRSFEHVLHYQVDAQGVFLVHVEDPRLRWCADFRACVELPVRLAPGQQRNWAIADGAVYFVGADNDDPDSIDRYRLADGHRERLAWPRPGALSRAIDVARDGSYAIIARTDRLDVDLQWVER